MHDAVSSESGAIEGPARSSCWKEGHCEKLIPFYNLPLWQARAMRPEAQVAYRSESTAEDLACREVAVIGNWVVKQCTALCLRRFY